MTAPTVFPDIEAVLVAALPGLLSASFGITARLCTDTPADLATAVPVVSVNRSTGADVQNLLDRPVVDIDCYMPTRSAAVLLGRQVHAILHKQLQGSLAGGAVIGLVNTVKGPGWLAYQDLDVRRCNATYEIYQHPPPA